MKQIKPSNDDIARRIANSKIVKKKVFIARNVGWYATVVGVSESNCDDLIVENNQGRRSLVNIFDVRNPDWED